MSKPWFSSKGQIVSFIGWIISLLLAGYSAWPQFRQNEFFSAGSILFYLLIGFTIIAVIARVAEGREQQDVVSPLAGASQIALPAPPGVLTLAAIVIFLLGVVAGGKFLSSSLTSPGHVVLTVENVESHVKQWLETFNYGIRKLPLDPNNVHFGYIATNQQNRKIIISRRREFEHYLIVQANVLIGDEHRKRMEGLSPQESEAFQRRLILDLTRLRLGFSTNLGGPLTTITLEKRIPITDYLTEALFIQTLDDLDTAELFVLLDVPIQLDTFPVVKPKP